MIYRPLEVQSLGTAKEWVASRRVRAIVADLESRSVLRWSLPAWFFLFPQIVITSLEEMACMRLAELFGHVNRDQEYLEAIRPEVAEWPEEDQTERGKWFLSEIVEETKRLSMSGRLN